MMVVKLTEAFDHLRLPADYPPAQVTPYLYAAVSVAEEFCQRKFYVGQSELNAALNAIPALVRDANLSYDQAISTAQEIEDAHEQAAAINVACRIKEAALQTCDRELWGMVITDDIKAAILLQLDHLFENRSENVTGTIVSELKMGAASLLWPHRVKVGV